MKARQVIPQGFCIRCGHHEDAHVLVGLRCEVEVRDYGEMDCQCTGLKLCAACEGDPEAHGLHVCAGVT